MSTKSGIDTYWFPPAFGELPRRETFMGTVTYRNASHLEGWLTSTGRARYVVGGTHRSYNTKANSLSEKPKPSSALNPRYKAPNGTKPGDLVFFLWTNQASKPGVPAADHVAMVTAVNPLRVAHHNQPGTGFGNEAIGSIYLRAVEQGKVDKTNRLVMRFVHIVRTGF